MANNNIVEMRLNPAPLKKIKAGQKKYELRLYDKKRRKLNKGDFIEFTNTENDQEQLMVKVEELKLFESFEELYGELSLLEFGYSQGDLSTASPKDMQSYYSKSQQEKYGVVGIRLSLLDSKA